MWFPRVFRLLVGIQHSILGRHIWLIPCCVAVVALAVRQMSTTGPISTIPSIPTNRTVYYSMDTSKTVHQIPFGNDSQSQKPSRTETNPYMNPFRGWGWFVLPETLSEKPGMDPGMDPQKHSEDILETPGDNKSMGANCFEQLHRDLQLCEEDIRSYNAVPNKGVPEALIIRLISARKKIDCLLQRAASKRHHDPEPCPEIHNPDFDLIDGYPSALSKVKERFPSMSGVLTKYCPPCAAQQNSNGKEKRDGDLTDGELLSEEGQHLIPSRYFIRQGKGKSRKPTSWKSHDCEKTICGEKDLHKECSKEASRLSSTMKTTCQMCYPTRQEDAIKKHCVKRRRREMEVLYVLCAILITLIVSAAFLVVLQDFRRRNMSPDRATTQNRLTKGWSLPLVKLPTLGWTAFRRPHRFWYPGFFQSFNRRRAPLDVEGDPALFKADAYIRKHDDPQSPWPYTEEMQNLPPAIHKDRARSDTLKLRKVGARHAVTVQERVPVMPPARSSSIQLPPTSVDLESQNTLRNVGNRNDGAHQNQHFATFHARSPTERVTIAREMSRTLQ